MNGIEDRAKSLEFFQYRDTEEVACMDYGRGLAEEFDAALGKPADAIRHMGVGNDGDQNSGRILMAMKQVKKRPH